MRSGAAPLLPSLLLLLPAPLPPQPLLPPVGQTIPLRGQATLRSLLPPASSAGQLQRYQEGQHHLEALHQAGV